MNNWSAKYQSCINCKTTEKRHMAKGLCSYCYLKKHHNDPVNKSKVKAQKHKHYLEKQKPQSKQVREIKNFDGLRSVVLVRDKYACVDCGMAGDSSTLVVHHKDGSGRNKTIHNNTLDNLVTLCRACHLAEHKDLVLGARFKCGVDGWSRHHDKCIMCGTTERKHYSHGRCVNCRARYVRSKQQ